MKDSAVKISSFICEIIIMKKFFTIKWSTLQLSLFNDETDYNAELKKKKTEKESLKMNLTQIFFINSVIHLLECNWIRLLWNWG